MIVDIQQGNHKMIWYQEPTGIEKFATLQVKKGTIAQLDEKTQLSFYVSIWQHSTITCPNGKPLTIWIGSQEEVEKQLIEIYQKAGLDPQKTDFLKCIPNIDLLEVRVKQKSAKSSTKRKKSDFPPQDDAAGFSVKDIQLGQEYEGYIKLMYNYGIFVTVKGVEGLLHKKQIVVPDGIEWKKYYNIGDKIKVKAYEFKDIDGEKRVVWTQL